MSTTARDRFAEDWPESAAIAQRQHDVARGLEQNGILILDGEYCCSDGTPAVIGLAGGTLVLAAVAGSAEEAAAGIQEGGLGYLRADAAGLGRPHPLADGLRPGRRPA